MAPTPRELGRTVMTWSEGGGEMLTGEIAKHRIEERISDGASARNARGVGARRAAERRVRTRRLVGVATALLSLPFKH